MADNKNITYINKSFTEFKTNLLNYAKTYFPASYNDFSDNNPGSLFIETAAYVGDVMSFYLDTQIQENFLIYSKQKENLYALSYTLGYRPKASYASSTTLDIYQAMPATSSGGVFRPDTTYALLVPGNTIVSSTSTGVKFLTTKQLDFSDTGSSDTQIAYSTADYFIVKKSVPVISAEIKSTTFTFGAPQKFTTVNIIDDNILQILDVTDSNGNTWYEVPYLAQSTIFEKLSNPTYSSDQVPYLLNIKRVPYRFTSRLLSSNNLQLEFGSGVSSKTDQTILPTPDNIQLGLVPGISLLTSNYNQASVFYTQEYGIAPSNTTLTVRYLVGGGIASNVPSNDLTNLTTSGVTFKSGYSGPLSSTILSSVVSTNPTASAGGRGGDEIEEIRNNALYSYSSQLRAVTKTDYILRTLSLPSDYGSIAKAYITQDFEDSGNNPLTLDLYVLAYNTNKQLTTAPTALKNNLVTYLEEYRMVTDAINIKNAYYINIGINFEIIVYGGYNNNDILTNCILALQDHFNIDKWQINQPIIISNIIAKLLQIKGVQSVSKIEIINKQDSTGTTYSQYGYDIEAATRKGIIYPSLNPSIFEVRYPNTDIQGRVVVF